MQEQNREGRAVNGSLVGEYDVIVIGVGGMGSAACYELSRRGARVLGLERFDIPHAMGSSHGVTRIIRLAYYEDPSYVPLLKRAYERWRALERDAGERLLHITGSIDASHADGAVFGGSLTSCQLHGLDHEVLTGTELNARFPGFHLPDDHLALLQPDGGFLLSERCIVAHVELAIDAGAHIHARERVLGWESTDGGVTVTTDRGRYRAAKIIVSPGAWVGEIVPDLLPIVKPERQVLAWLQPARRDIFLPERFPVFNLAVDEGRYYGFPLFGIPGVKLGRYHHLGETIDSEAWDREPNRADETIIREFAERYVPDAVGPAMTLTSCIFTNTPDEHFIIDLLPGDERVVVASPCSGHGFKFCAVVGEILADLAVDGSTPHDISLFRLDRFKNRIA